MTGNDAATTGHTGDAKAGEHDAVVVVNIEDHPANQRLVERIFALRPGVNVLTASTGDAGIELVHRENPDVVLLDLHLPDAHGADVLRALRADPPSKPPVIVVISADANRSQVDALLAAGADRYLTKPVAVDELLALVDELSAR